MPLNDTQKRVPTFEWPWRSSAMDSMTYRRSNAFWTARLSTDGVLPLSSRFINYPCDASSLKKKRHLDQGHMAWYRLQGQFQDRHYIPLDVQMSRSWVLIHQALFHTYAHHDSKRYSTWTLVTGSKKIWVFLRPLVSNTASFSTCKNHKEYDCLVSQYLDTSTAHDPSVPHYRGEHERYFIVAKPGDIMYVSRFLVQNWPNSSISRIQSAATLHEVYTPTLSVTLGGHFVTYNAMHLTEVASAYDVRTQGKLTNQEHLSSTDTLCMMMCHLANAPNTHKLNHIRDITNPSWFIITQSYTKKRSLPYALWSLTRQSIRWRKSRQCPMIRQTKKLKNKEAISSEPSR